MAAVVWAAILLGYALVILVEPLSLLSHHVHVNWPGVHVTWAIGAGLASIGIYLLYRARK